MSQEILDKIGGIHDEFKKAQDAVDVQLKKSADGAAEMKSKVDKIEADLAATLDMKKQMEETQASVKRIADNVEKAKEQAEEKGIDLKAYASGIKKFLLKGDKAVFDEAEQKAMSVGSDPDGGYSVMPFIGDMNSIIFDTSPVRSLASVTSIGTDRYQGFLRDERVTVSWGDENTQGSENTAKYGKFEIPVHNQVAIMQATENLLEDSEWDIAQMLQQDGVDEFGRAEATAFVLGDGVDRPQGFLTAEEKTSNADVYERGKVGTLVTASASAIASDELADLRSLLKVDYRANARIVYNRKTEGVLRKLKDGQGNYLWQPSFQMGVPDQIIGQRTAIFEDMPDIATGAKAVAIADFSRTYLIVDRLGVSILEDPYTSFPNRKWKMRRRVGGGLQSFDAIKYLKQA